MNLNDFIEFNPLTDSGSKIPEAPGNYIVTIRDIKALPTLGHQIETQQFRGQELIYTGITKKDLHHRISTSCRMMIRSRWRATSFSNSIRRSTFRRMITP